MKLFITAAENKKSIVNKIALISNNGKYEENDSFNSIQTLKRKQGLVRYLSGKDACCS